MIKIFSLEIGNGFISLLFTTVQLYIFCNWTQFISCQKFNSCKKTCIIKLQYHFTLHVFSKMYGFYFFCFFFSPTSLDAMVFGYIAPLIKGPLISCQLVKHINGFSNLCNHTNRILSRFFPPTPEGQSIHVFEAGNVIIFHNEIVNYAENKNVSGQCFIYFCNIQIWKDSVRKRKKRMKQ